MELVQASVKAIGQIVLKVQDSVRMAASVLKDIVKNGQTLALQEAVQVAQIIFRKFPNKFEDLMKDLAAKVEEYHEPEAKAAIIWIVGEFAEKINNSEKIVQNFVDCFFEDPDHVKL
jgi:vesicle coat complex subunit